MMVLNHYIYDIYIFLCLDFLHSYLLALWLMNFVEVNFFIPLVWCIITLTLFSEYVEDFLIGEMGSGVFVAIHELH